MKTYLSIDMDYWNGRTPAYTRRSLFSLLKRLKKRRVPMMACMNHQQMLNHVNDSSARRLINLDTHSDLSQSVVTMLNCGTWVSYVKWRQQGEFIWCHRRTIREGDCSSWGNGKRIFLNNGNINNTVSDWKKVKRTKMLLPNYRYLTTHTVAAGLVLSPDFIEDELEYIFYEAIAKFNIDYFKGRRNEDHFRNATPPGR